jgi:hypothetical protein
MCDKIDLATTDTTTKLVITFVLDEEVRTIGVDIVRWTNTIGNSQVLKGLGEK